MAASKRDSRVRRETRTKRAKLTINKTIPTLLKGDARARRGVESAELIVDPPLVTGGGNARQGRSSNESKSEDGSSQADYRAETGNIGASGVSPPQVHISLRVADTLEAACRLVYGEQDEQQHLKQQQQQQSSGSPTTTHPPQRPASSRPRVAILNMASPLRPGGGVLTGASSQEESLCSRTTLYPSLREEFYRLPEVGGIYTRDVLVFASWDAAATGLARRERFYVDVVTAAMLRFPDVEEEEEEEEEGRASSCASDGGGMQPNKRLRYSLEKDRELALRKMRGVMRMCRSHGVEKVVLGAWGCGAYGNPVYEVARAWKRVLLGPPSGRRKVAAVAEAWDGLEVMFAIKDREMAKSFYRYFGEEIQVESGELESGREGSDGQEEGHEESEGDS